MSNHRSKLNKLIIRFLATYSIITLIAIAAILYLPDLQYHLAIYQSKASLPSLRAAGAAIAQYESEYGSLPNPDRWYYNAQQYTSPDSLSDPHYTKLNTKTKSETSGWGMNAWLNLSLGNANPDPINFQSERLPKDAILLLPSGQNNTQPLRNGNQPPSPLSPGDSTPTEHSKRLGGLGPIHGRYGLYLTVSGDVLLLTPEQAAQKLKLRPIPNSQTPTPPQKTEKPDADADWETNSNVQKFETHYELKKGSISTPYIPIKHSRITLITLRSQTQPNTKFTTTVSFFNTYKYLINTTGKETTTTLSLAYAQNEKLRTRQPISTEANQTIGFFPNDGHAAFETKTKGKSAIEPGTDHFLTLIHPIQAQYAPKTPIVQTTTTSIQHTAIAHNDQWQETTIEISPDQIPPQTQYFTITLNHQTRETLKLEPIKIKTKDPAPTIQSTNQ
jgi:hypothetical protein